MASSSSAGVSPQTETLANEIFTTTMSPYCPGLLLSDCPSGKATALKDSIRTEIANGRAPDEIRTELVATYKTQLDARPPMAGFGSLMWVVPVLILFIGALVLFRWIRLQVKN